MYVAIFDRDRDGPLAKSALCLVTREPRLTALIDELRADGFTATDEPGEGGHSDDPARVARLRAWMASNSNRLIATRDIVGVVKPIRELNPNLLRCLTLVRGHLKASAAAFVEDSSSTAAESTAFLERDRYVLGTFLALLLVGECLLRARPAARRSSLAIIPLPPQR